MTAKIFSTYDKQLDVLKSRGLIINDDDKVKEILKNENYYNIINGYKDLFLVTTNTTNATSTTVTTETMITIDTMVTTDTIITTDSKVSEKTKITIITPEKYISGVNFDELYAVYKFDRELRNIFFKKILILENQIKSLIAYKFSEKYGHDDYLKIDNFESPKKVEIIKLIANIHSDIARQLGKDKSLNHYLEDHGYIPLWVLIKIFTFGRLSIFYGLMKEADRRSISMMLTDQYTILEKDLKHYMKIISIFRNLCAHEERMYDFKCLSQNKRPINVPISVIHTNLNIPNGNGFFDLLISLKLLLSKEDFLKLFEKLKIAIDNLDREISSIKLDDILKSMLFPANWKDITKY